MSLTYLTKDEYNSLLESNQCDELCIYVTTDTRELYLGSSVVSDAIRYFTGTMPENPISNVFYVDTETYKVYIYNNEWVNIADIASKFDLTNSLDPSNEDMAVTGKAVYEYIIDVIDGGAIASNIFVLKSQIVKHGEVDTTLEDASDDEVPSERAVNGLLSWQHGDLDKYSDEEEALLQLFKSLGLSVQDGKICVTYNK